MTRLFSNWALCLFLLAVCCFGSGCSLLRPVRVDAVATSVEKPSNVALYVSVRNVREPVDGLMPENFKVYENEQEVPSEQSQLSVLDKELAAAHHVLVLVDMSQSNDDESKRVTSRAVAGFIAKVNGKQGVTVYAFDGSPDLQLVGEFPRGASASPSELPDLSAYSVRDPSRNLYGAVRDGLNQLDARLMQGQKPVRVGTLVVFTRGPDIAGRLNERELRDLIDRTPHHVVSIGVGQVSGDYYLDDIGSSAVIRAQDRNTIGIAFEEAGTKVSSLYDMYYLVSYCSPARAGRRRLRLEVSFSTREGDERRGSVEQEFDATGFGPGCDPHAVPHFVMKASAEPSAQAPAATTEPANEPKKPARARELPPPPTDNDTENDTIVPPPAKPGYAPTKQ